MTSETLHYESARFAQQLFNNDPKNLQSLQAELDVKASAREGWIKLEGAKEAVTRGRQLFEHLESALKAGAQISAEALRDWANERVAARYQKLREIQIRADFPRSVAGKTLKREMRDAFWAGRDTKI